MFSKLFSRKAAHQVRLNGDGPSFEVGRNQTVLESALEKGVAFPHDCTVGTCGSCRSRLVSGKVDAITPFGYTLSREELAAGYILACQAVPESDLVLEVEIGSTPVAHRKARITSIVDLTHDIKKVTWETDGPVAYRAGQYMNISWPDAPAHRSYSFCTAPDEAGQTSVSAFIRKVPGGAFTEGLFGDAFAGATFDIAAPYGNFWLRDGDGPIILIGGGSGLSPLMSLLEDAVAKGVKRDAILLFGGRGERDLYCLEEIAAIAARWKGRFDFWPILSEEQSADRRTGMVTSEIPAAVAQLGGADHLQAYLCGPPGMIDAGIAALSAAGVAMSAIHHDKFTDASTQKN